MSNVSTLGEGFEFLARSYDERFGPGAWAKLQAKQAAEAEAGIVECNDRCGARSQAGVAFGRERLRSRWRCGACENARTMASREAYLADAWASIPERYLPTFETSFAGTVASTVMAEPRGAARNVVLVGPAGAGKTVLACGYLATWLDAHRETGDREGNPGGALFVSAYRLARARQEHRLGGGEAPLVSAALRASTLVLDDVGSEPEVRDSAVPEVLYERHGESRRTILTTWMRPAASGDDRTPTVAGRYGDGIARRIFQGALILNLPARGKR